MTLNELRGRDIDFCVYRKPHDTTSYFIAQSASKRLQEVDYSLHQGFIIHPFDKTFASHPSIFIQPQWFFDASELNENLIQKIVSDSAPSSLPAEVPVSYSPLCTGKGKGGKRFRFIVTQNFWSCSYPFPYTAEMNIVDKCLGIFVHESAYNIFGRMLIIAQMNP